MMIEPTSQVEANLSEMMWMKPTAQYRESILQIPVFLLHCVNAGPSWDSLWGAWGSEASSTRQSSKSNVRVGLSCHLGFMSDDLTTSWTWRHNIFTYSRFFSFKICGRGGIYTGRVNLGTKNSSRWIPQRNTLCHFEEKQWSPMFSWLLMGLYCL